MVQSLPDTLAAPAEPPADAVPECWEADKSHFPYVIRITDKTHRVTIGYPAGPRDWRSECGWAFGMSVKAKPALSLPACHLMMCEKCFGVERNAAKQRAGAKVLESLGRTPDNQGILPAVD